MNIYYRQAFLAALIAASSHGVALAEDTGLPVIDVTGSAVTDTQAPHCEIIPQKELKSLAPATSDSASLLKNIPGLNLQGGGAVSSLPVIRGLADDRLRIKVDGMDLISACGNHMNPALSYVDPSNVGSAAVFAGITPVSIGGDSIGGTILVDSEEVEFAKPGEGILSKGEIGAFYRSNGNVQGGNVAATVASENVSLSYRGSTAKGKDYKAGGDFKPAGLAAAGRGWLAADEVGSSMYKSTNQSIAMAVLNGNHQFDVKLGLQDIPYQGWSNQRMDMTGNDSKQANLRYEGQYNWGELEARAYYENTKHAMQFGEDKLFWYGNPMPMAPNDGVPCTPSAGMMGCAAGMPMDTEGLNIGGSIKANIPLSAGSLLRVGGETQQYRLDDWWDPSGRMMAPNTFWNINGGKRDRLALFSEWESEWNSDWLTQFGVRYEQVTMDTGTVLGYNNMAVYAADAVAFNAANRKKTDNNIDLTALVRFTPTNTQTIEFGYGMKTRSPNLYERYTWSTFGMAMRMINMAGDGNGYVGNLNLRHETAHTISATFDFHDAEKKAWGVKVTPYYSYIKDYIDANRIANHAATTGFVYLRFANKSAKMHGVDVSGKLSLVEGSDFGSLSASGILNYVRGKSMATNDNLYNIMPLNGRIGVTHRLSGWTNTVEVEMVAAKTKVSKVRNEVPTSGYSLLNLRSSYEWEQVRIDVGAENLLDKFYNDPLGGAYLGQGKTMSGTIVPWGVPVPGMGRSFYVGMTVKL
ncbi:iron complex outermembrane recepter protein [Mariprofundus micogutta]|uniref:Iron complex outermembrane recepter protein n=1 Tax=Mariprofundus micogutta TaxID=1921010 RepID=A0A1L8CL01_9PROT|nr:TonB-dependent receptor [Mariprofundus micogutta]GAV19590.1 iron complex outermembrane recepter protein [Mariprofundus micogutta]